MDTHTSPADVRFFTAIGKLAIAWAHLEMGLDCMVDFTFHALDVEKKEREVPIQLSRKVRYLRRSFMNLPIPEDLKDRYNGFFNDILKEADIRNNIIHGAIVSHAEGQGTAEFLRMSRASGRSQPIRKTYASQEIELSIFRVNQLSGKAFTWFELAHSEILPLLHKLSQQTP